MKTVCISVDDAGKYSVGLEPAETMPSGAPPEGSPAEESGESPDQEAAEGDDTDQGQEEGADYMQPAHDLNDALMQAKQLLEADDNDAQAESDMASGFEAVHGNGLNGAVMR